MAALPALQFLIQAVDAASPVLRQIGAGASALLAPAAAARTELSLVAESAHALTEAGTITVEIEGGAEGGPAAAARKGAEAQRVLARASGETTGVMQRLVAVADRLAAPLRRARDELRATAETAGLERVRAQLVSLRGAAAGLGGPLRSALAPVTSLAGVAGVTGLAGIGAMVQRYVTNADSLFEASRRIGSSVESLAQWRYAARMTGVDSSTLEHGMQRLNTVLGGAALGRNRGAATMFQQLHISLRDGTGHVRQANDVLLDLASAMERNTDPAVRAQIAQTALGRGLGTELLPLLIQGRAALEGYLEQARQNGTITQAQAEAAHRFAMAQRALSAAIGGVQMAVGARLMPLLQPLIERLTLWFRASKDLIAVRVERVVTAITDALSGVDFAAIDRFVFGFTRLNAATGQTERVPGLLERLGTAIDRVVGFMGGWGNATIALAVLLNAQLINAVIGLGRELITAGYEIGKFVIRMTIGPIVAQFVAGLRAGQSAIMAFNLACAANPVNLILMAILALAAAAYLIYENWGAVGPWVEQLCTNIATMFGGVVDFVVGIFTGDLARAAAGLGTIWDGLSGIWGTVWDGIRSVFLAFLGWIDGLFGTDLRGAAERILPAWSGVEAFFAGLWDGVRGVFLSFLGWIDGLFGTDLRGAAERILPAWSGLGAFFTGLWDGIKQSFRAAWAVMEPIVNRIRDAVGWVQAAGGAIRDVAARLGLVSSAGEAAETGGGRPGLAPETGPAEPTLSQAYQAAAGGEVVSRHIVDFRNLPRGAEVSTESSGSGPVQQDVATGWAMGF